MEKNRPQGRGTCSGMSFWGSIILSLLLGAAAGLLGQAFADESITVSCYNLQKSQNPIGNIVVYDTAQAAAACNLAYYDCRGKCVGCFSDSDYIDSVCVTATGTLFLK